MCKDYTLGRREHGECMSFLFAAITNDHKCSDRKQHRVIILQILRSAIYNGSHWDKV